MKELSFIESIKNSLACSSYLGDDCAYLEDLDIFVTHDTLVEDVHFSMYTTSPYLLGRKAVSVNLSDLAASLSLPKYITISLSLPKNIMEDFVSELYRGINDVCLEHSVKVIGGDITSSDKIVISVSAIGKKNSCFLTSRSFAKKGDYIVTTGNYGASSAGLYAFSNFLMCDDKLKSAHLNPVARLNEAKLLSSALASDIALMDTSDGLVDALYKIALASKHSLEIDFDKVPVLEEVRVFSSRNDIDYKNFVKWGGEDFELIACVSEEIYSKLDSDNFTCIGKVLNKDFSPSVVINYGNSTEKITKDVFEQNSYKHF